MSIICPMTKPLPTLPNSRNHRLKNLYSRRAPQSHRNQHQRYTGDSGSTGGVSFHAPELALDYYYLLPRWSRLVRMGTNDVL